MIEKDSELKRARDDLSKSKISAEQLSEALPAKDLDFRMVQRQYNELNERVAQLKADLTMANLHVKKAEALKRDVARIQAHVQRRSFLLREYQGKLDAAHSKERELERMIRGKDQLINKKDELLKRSSIGGSVGKDWELKDLRAEVAKLRMMNLAESDIAAEKAMEPNNHMSHTDSHMEWKNA
ncbi:hypothetical protein GIB67_009883 [Kingdonia uniflora]|uniref:Uncharacterized protein n=1 Tax=Kingdonia uniflora TaxID=39325 RepID=A0A7J7L7Z8_9MAGN|nr:hypothetical protein GIB67_009883 [Kingdonia uniflora]